MQMNSLTYLLTYLTKQVTITRLVTISRKTLESID